MFVAYSNKTTVAFAVQLDSDFVFEKGWPSYDRNPRFCYDVDGDGLADLVGFADDGVYVQFSTGNAFQPKTLVLSGLGYNAGWTSQNSFPICLGNVQNIIGGADIIGFGNDGVYISNYNGATFTTPTLVISGQYGVGSGWTTFDATPRLCADMDGDGRTDIIAFGPTTTSVVYAQSDGTFAQTAETTTQMTSGFTSYDVNPR